MRTILLSHNKTAYQKVMRAFETSRMTCVCHPTGTGKSYIVAAVAESFDKVLILAPNNFILQQQESILDWRGGIDYRNYSWLIKNVWNVTEKYDLIVLDEFHRAGAQEWGAAVQLLIESQPQAKIFGTSATPIRYSEDERDMTDELFDGHVASNITIAEAWTVYNILPIPRYVSGLFRWDKTISEAQERIERSRSLSDKEKRERIFRLSNKRLDWDLSYGMPTILRKHMEKDARRVIVFCAHIEDLEQMRQQVCRWFREAGFTIASISILHSKLKDSEQREQMNRFEGDSVDGVKLMFAIDMLNEGIHVPNVSAVIMLRTTESRIIYMQQMGRCLTAANTENPLVLDMVDNITTTTAIKDLQIEFDRLEHIQAEREGRAPRRFEVVDYTLGVRDLISKLVPQHVVMTAEERLALVKQFIADNDRQPVQGKDKDMFVHWRWLCMYAADNEEVKALRRKYGYIPVTIDEAVAELEAYHQRTGLFLSFPNQRKNKEALRLSGLWQRLRRNHPNHPVVAAWLKRLEEQKSAKFPETMQKVRQMAERGEKFMKTNEYLFLHRNYADHPEFVAFHKQYCKQNVIMTVDEHLDVLDAFCHRTDRLPTHETDGQAYNSYNYLRRHCADHPRLKAIVECYHKDNKLARRRAEDLKAIEQFYCENGYLPLTRTSLGLRWSRLKRSYPDDPDVQRIEQNCRYKQTRTAYVKEDVRIYCEMNGELPTKTKNRQLYVQWRGLRLRHPHDPDVLDLIAKYGNPRQQPRKNKQKQK